MIEPNNIYNGNSYELIKEIPSNSVDLVYIDIPYGISYSGAGIAKKGFVMKDKLASFKSITNGIDYAILDELCRVMKNIYIYIWCSKSQIKDLINYFDRKDVNFNILVWCKTNSAPFGASPFLPNIEYCLVFYEKGVKFNNGVEHKSKWYLSPTNQNDGKKFKHPTIKPLELVERHIKNSTNVGDVVLDCFMGSGTTCVACKNLNRKYIGIELEEKYFKIAQDRLNNIETDGQTFLL